MDTKNKFNLHVEQLYPRVFTISGYALFLLALLAFLNTAFILGFVFIIIGVFLSFSIVGIQVDMTKNRFKQYERKFWIKMGKWRNFDDFPDVSVLTINQKHTSRSLTNTEFTSKSVVYKVFLLNETHREKFLVKEFKTEDKAILYAKDFAARTATEFTVFSPYISEATLARRR